MTYNIWVSNFIFFFVPVKFDKKSVKLIEKKLNQF
jgi:hypothetical protein